jgi:acyl-CoA thioesterase
VSARADRRRWGPSLFGIDTSVEAIHDRRFLATITDHWNGLAGRPLGGYVLAVCLRAIQQALPFSDPLVVSAFFLNPVDPGPVEIHIEAARAGRRSATAEARLCQHGVEALRSIATFTDLEHTVGQHLVVGSPPVLPAPDVAVDLHDGAPVPTASIVDRIDYRVSQALEANRASTDRLHTKLWMRLKQGGTQDLLSLPLLVDAAPPAVMELGATGSTTIQLSAYVRGRASSEWLACQATTRCVIDGYHDEDFEIWDEHGRLLVQARQLAKLPRGDLLLPGHDALTGRQPDPVGQQPARRSYTPDTARVGD